MANLKEIRNRISSVSSNMKITQAMKMVSASKFKKASDAIVQMRPFAEKLQEILVNLSASMEGDESQNAYTTVREQERVLLVAVSANRGLCGAFNSNVVKATRRIVEEEYAGVEVDVMCIGKKAADTLKNDFNIVEINEQIYSDLSYKSVAEIAQSLMDLYAEGKYDRIDFVYNKFKNAAVQHVTHEQFLPISLPSEEDMQGNTAEYLYEPTKRDIIEEVIPKSLKIQVYKIMLDTNASEHGARMTAMHKATDNAKALKDDLSLQYNKARQAAITNEILEIVSGAEALS